MTFVGQLRSFGVRSMTAFPTKNRHSSARIECPFRARNRDMPRSKVYRSFDHLVGGHLQCQRHFETEHLGGLEIDEKLELRRLQDRQITRLGALENLARVGPYLTVGTRYVGAIAHETPCLHILSRNVHSGNGMARG